MSTYDRKGYFSFGKAIEMQQRDELPTAGKFMVRRAGLSASTFREDPLPDRTVVERGVTLHRVRWLERPDP